MYIEQTIKIDQVSWHTISNCLSSNALGIIDKVTHDGFQNIPHSKMVVVYKINRFVILVYVSRSSETTGNEGMSRNITSYRLRVSGAVTVRVKCIVMAAV